jgi:CRP/FNR family transcriptional regulator
MRQVATQTRFDGRETHVHPISTLALFSSLSPAELDELAAVSLHRDYRRDEVLFFEGEPPEWLYVLVSGFVKLIKHSDDGRDIILHVAMPGDIIGGVAAFGRRPHPFTAQPMVPSSALRIAGSDFARVMHEHPDVSQRMMDDLIERLVEAHETMKSLATERVERRIARQLVSLAERTGRDAPAGIEITVPLARQDVADIAGTTVETAIRVLSRWRRRGIVLTIDGRLVVTDLEALQDVAEAGLC